MPPFHESLNNDNNNNNNHNYNSNHNYSYNLRTNFRTDSWPLEHPVCPIYPFCSRGDSDDSHTNPSTPKRPNKLPYRRRGRSISTDVAADSCASAGNHRSSRTHIGDGIRIRESAKETPRNANGRRRFVGEFW